MKVLKPRRPSPEYADHYPIRWAVAYVGSLEHWMTGVLMEKMHENGDLSDDAVIDFLDEFGGEFKWGEAPDGECGICTIVDGHAFDCIRINR